jgi:hypothetical protein
MLLMQPHHTAVLSDVISQVKVCFVVPPSEFENREGWKHCIHKLWSVHEYPS